MNAVHVHPNQVMHSASHPPIKKVTVPERRAINTNICHFVKVRSDHHGLV